MVHRALTTGRTRSQSHETRFSLCEQRVRRRYPQRPPLAPFLRGPTILYEATRRGLVLTDARALPERQRWPRTFPHPVALG